MKHIEIFFFKQMLLYFHPDNDRKPNASQVNKLKRQERLEELDQVIEDAKASVQEVIMKLDEAKSLSATAEVSWLNSKEMDPLGNVYDY